MNQLVVSGICVFAFLSLVGCGERIIKEPRTNQEVGVFACDLQQVKHNSDFSEKERQLAHIADLGSPRIPLTQAEEDELFEILARSKQTRQFDFHLSELFGGMVWTSYCFPLYNVVIGGDKQRYEFEVYRESVHYHPGNPAVLNEMDCKRVRQLIIGAVDRMEIVDGCILSDSVSDSTLKFSLFSDVSFSPAELESPSVISRKTVLASRGGEPNTPSIYCIREIKPDFEIYCDLFLGCEGELGYPVEAFTQFYLLCDHKITRIKTPADMTMLSRKIRILSMADALAYARIFTDRDWFYCFSDPFAIEVYPEKATVKPDGCGFIVTRTLLLGKDATPEGYQLADVEERISCEGGYDRKIVALRERVKGTDFGFAPNFE